MSLQLLLDDLQRQQIRIWVEAGQLKFTAAKGAMTEPLKAQLMTHKAELIELLSKRQQPQAVPAASVQLLSFAQQRLLFMAQAFGDSALYNMPAVYQIDGPLSPQRLQHCLDQLLQGHPALRTAFVQQHGDYVAELQPVTQWPLQHQFVTAAELAAAEAQALAYPFCPEQAPLCRAFLFSLDPHSHRLILNLHHLIADGWSHQLLWKQLWQLYRGEPLQFSQYHYGHFVASQRQWLHSPAYQQQKQFWLTHLTGAPARIDLPLDKPRPAQQDYRGAVCLFELDATLTAQLTRYASQQHSSLYLVGLAALFFTLHKYAGQQDICIGTPVANRQQQCFEEVVGFFANVLTLRQQLDPQRTLAELTRLLRDQVLDCFEYQDFPFEQVVEHLQPERSLSYSPLFQVMFIFEQSQQPEQVAGLQLQPGIVDVGLSKFDLTLTLKKHGNRLTAGIEYSCALFEADTIQRLSRHYQQVLRQLVSNDQISLASLSLMDDSERQQVLYGFNQTALSYASHAPCYRQILQQASIRPQQLALTDGTDSWTYQQLLQQSSAIAARLQQHGIGRGDRVGIYLDRRCVLVASMLAVWQCGAAYVPVDLHFPLVRQQMIVQDASLTLLLTRSQLATPAAALGATVLLVDEQQTTAPEFQPVTPDPEDLAYLIFTSGSTGRPKGVKVTHRNVQNFFAGLDQQVEPSVAAAGTVPVFRALTSISFDISVLELFWTLSRGFQVLLEQDHFSALAAQGQQARQQRHPKLSQLQFSLFYFASDESASADKYFLLREGASFADQHGFSAVWIPERHFHPFGGQFPNPVVAAAAVAAITKRIEIRSGSVVLPLHNPIRVAEEWSMVDNLSQGRVGLSIASGWHFNDFVLKPENFRQRHDIMKSSISQLKQLWAGQQVAAVDGNGDPALVRIYPSPVRPELPIWITAAANPETFRYAGEIGANVLTHLLGQSLAELKEKIAIYRQARQQAGFDPASGNVTLMLHTYLCDDHELAMQRIEKPFKDYLRTSINLLLPVAREQGLDAAEDLELVVEAGFQRYAGSSALFGTATSCLALVNQLAAIDIDEIGCLIDFGVDPELVVQSFDQLNQLRQRVQQETAEPLVLSGPVATHIQCTPSYARLMLESDQMRQSLSQVQGFFVGGEALSEQLATELKASIAGRLYNMYGPTETTVWSAISQVQGGDVRLGLPMANTRFYVLDEYRQPVPFGIKGELYIAGDGVSAGYWQRDDLTAEAFWPDPFCSEPGARMYRTGDMVRQTVDGRCQYLHRRDNQVKVRGFRVELDEIQRALEQQPQVTQAAVVIVPHEQQGGTIFACVVAADSSDPSGLSTELLVSLRQQLPDYMVPSRLLVLDSLPYTPNGKLDTRALISMAGQTQQRQLTPPVNDTEQRLSQIWQQLLALDVISTQDSFFELGGHSLLLGKLQQQLQQQFQVLIDIIDLFKYPTIQSLAARLDAEQAGTDTTQTKRERRQVDRAVVDQVRNQMRQRSSRGK